MPNSPSPAEGLALIPAAGLGTRMHSITGGSAKELLTLHGRPIIEHVLSVAKAAGLKSCIISRPDKSDLNRWCEEQGHAVFFQPEMAGLADALTHVDQPGAAAVLLPDGLFRSGDDPTALCMEAVLKGADGAIAVAEVADEETSKFGCVALNGEQITEIVEKPAPGEAPSRWAVAGRYALSHHARTALQAFVIEQSVKMGGAEIGISPFIARRVQAGHCWVAVKLAERTKRFDTGDPEGYREAQQSWQ